MRGRCTDRGSHAAAARRGYVALAAVVAVATALRVALIAAGPDLDTDSYGHALLGRVMLERPLDVTLHWVWLPLWHAVAACVAALGGGLTALRGLNVALAVAPPFVLAATLRARARREVDDDDDADDADVAQNVRPFAAGAALALMPLGLALGASGQSEVLFLLLLLAACLAWETARPVAAGAALAGAALAAAALLRFEAWVVAPVFALGWLARDRTARGALAWLLPASAALAWCAAHYAQTHEVLGFVRRNGEYVRAMQRAAPAAAGALGVLRDAAWYPVGLPARELGVALALCALPGAWWFARRGPATHRAVALVLLAFFTVGQVRHTHLGHARHYLALAPFLATALAAGACEIARFVAARWRAARVGPARAAAWACAALLAALLVTRTAPTAREVAALARDAFAADRRAARLVREAAGARGVVFCDQARVELFSGLPRARFVRWSVRDVRPFHVGLAASRDGVAVVASSEARAEPLASWEPSVVLLREGGLVVLRVDAAHVPADSRAH